MSRINRHNVVAASLLAACATVPVSVAAQQTASPSQTSPGTTRPPVMAPQTAAPGQPTSTAQSSRRAAAPQGFSVVLVLGDLQGTSAADDVPIAARKALTDMREFLPFKSYRLLDAAWLMCCGEPRSATAGERRPPNETANAASQVLRGPDDQEYELKLWTSRTENGRVFVRFALFGSVPVTSTGATSVNSDRTTKRRIADLQDRAELMQRQIQETKKKVDVGMASGSDIPKMEVELRSIQREIDDLRARLETATAPPPAPPPAADRQARADRPSE